MAFSILITDNFKKEFKRLSRKFSSLRVEIETLRNEILDHPQLGTPIGHGFYKIRLSIASKGKGKRGGGRVITFVKVLDETVFLVSVYDKSEQSDIAIHDLQNLMNL